MSLVLLALWTVAGLIAAALALLAAASLGDREARVVAIGVIVLSLALLIAGVDGAA